VSKQSVQRVSENEEMDLVESSAPTETKKEIVHGVGARNVEAPATQNSFAPPKKKNGWWWEPELTGNFCSGWVPLRRGQM
jgi:hypothetical protein